MENRGRERKHHVKTFVRCGKYDAGAVPKVHFHSGVSALCVYSCGHTRVSVCSRSLATAANGSINYRLRDGVCAVAMTPGQRLTSNLVMWMFFSWIWVETDWKSMNCPRPIHLKSTQFAVDYQITTKQHSRAGLNMTKNVDSNLAIQSKRSSTIHGVGFLTHIFSSLSLRAVLIYIHIFSLLCVIINVELKLIWEELLIIPCNKPLCMECCAVCVWRMENLFNAWFVYDGSSTSTSFNRLLLPLFIILLGVFYFACIFIWFHAILNCPTHEKWKHMFACGFCFLRFAQFSGIAADPVAVI